jgi:AcrR family transcriptional regulator
MTLADVAGRLGMTTPSVRYYFRRKEDLAAACLLAALDRVEALIAKAAARDTPEARVAAYVELYVDLLAAIRRGEESPLAFFCDVRAFTSQNSEPIIAGYNRMFGRLRRFFTDAGRPWIDDRAASARAFLLQSMVLWTPAWIEEFDIADYPKIARRLVDVALNGLARPGATWAPAPLAMDTLLGAEHRATPQETFLVAATKLLNEQGYRGASIEKIAARLNMTKGSFYHYHAAKDDFVVECFRRTNDIVAHAQRAALELDADAWTRLTSACAALTAFQLSPNGPLLINAAISALPHTLAREMLRDWAKVTSRFATMVSDGVIDGSLRAVDARVAAEMVHAAVNSTAQLTLWADVGRIGDAPRFYLEPLFYGAFSEPTDRERQSRA